MDAWFFNAACFGIPLLGLLVMYGFRNYFRDDDLLEEFKKTKAQLKESRTSAPFGDSRMGSHFSDSRTPATVASAEALVQREPVSR